MRGKHFRGIRPAAGVHRAVIALRPGAYHIRIECERHRLAGHARNACGSRRCELERIRAEAESIHLEGERSILYSSAADLPLLRIDLARRRDRAGKAERETGGRFAGEFLEPYNDFIGILRLLHGDHLHLVAVDSEERESLAERSRMLGGEERAQWLIDPGGLPRGAARDPIPLMRGEREEDFVPALILRPLVRRPAASAGSVEQCRTQGMIVGLVRSIL